MSNGVGYPTMSKNMNLKRLKPQLLALPITGLKGTEKNQKFIVKMKY